MSFKECLYKAIFSFFVVTTLISAAICMLGSLLDPDAQFGYEAFISPMKYAALCILPSFVMLSREELSPVQFLLRKLLQLALVEAEILVIFLRNPSIPRSTLVFIAISVLVIFLIANLVGIGNDYLTARRMTSDLEKLQRS